MAARRRTTRVEPEVVNPLIVKVARVGGSVQDICLNGERTVAAALEAAGLEAEGGIRVNGRLVDEKAGLESGDIITVAGRIAGGLS